jgi:hypothetical protein
VLLHHGGDGVAVLLEFRDVLALQGGEGTEAGVTRQAQAVVLDLRPDFQLGPSGAVHLHHRTEVHGSRLVDVMALAAGHLVELKLPLGRLHEVLELLVVLARFAVVRPNAGPVDEEFAVEILAQVGGIALEGRIARENAAGVRRYSTEGGSGCAVGRNYARPRAAWLALYRALI